MKKALFITSHIGDRDSLARTLANAEVNPSAIVIATDAAAATKLEETAFVFVTLSYNTYTPRDLINIQVKALRRRFPDATLCLRGPYDFGFQKLGADKFVSLMQDKELAQLVIATL